MIPATIPTLILATIAHAEVLAAIHASASPDDHWGTTAFALQLGLPGAFGLLDPAGAFILARVVADEAEVLMLATAVPLRRQGRAAALLHAARVWAAARGAATLVLEVAVGNDAARALYAAAGLEPVGRRARYYGNGDDALILRVTPCAPATSLSRPGPASD